MSDQRPDGYAAPESGSTPEHQWEAASPQPEKAPRASGTAAKAGIAGLAAVALLGGGVAVADPFGWRGGSSSKLAAADIVPASASAYGGVNLDPGISQQVEMVKFAMKFPGIKDNINLSEQGDIKQQVWESVTKDKPCTDVNYDADIKPWLGDQIAGAVLDSTKNSIVVVQASDEAKARTGMEKLGKCWDWKTVGLAYRDGFLVAAESQTVADKAVADGKANPLSKRAEYTEDFGKVGTQGVASFWATKEGLEKLAESDAATKAEGDTGLPSAIPSAGSLAGAQDFRSMAGTLRFADGNPEMRVASKSNTAMKTSTTHTGLDKLPSDTTVAIGMSDGSQAVDDNWELAKKALEESGMTVADLERQANVKLPDDLKTLLGEDLRISVGKIPTSMASPTDLPIAISSKTDKVKLQELLDRTQVSAAGITVTEGQDGVQVAAMNTSWAQLVASGKENLLGEQDVFKTAYPTAEQAQFGLYVNIDAFKSQLTSGMSAADKANIEPLQAVGISSHTEDANYGVMVARVTAK